MGEAWRVDAQAEKRAEAMMMSAAAELERQRAAEDEVGER